MGFIEVDDVLVNAACESDAKHIVAVERKLVSDGESAPRPEGEILAHSVVLNEGRGYRVRS